MLASEHEVFEDITDTVERALADKKIRMECEARERYERDRISLYASGRKEAIIKSIKLMKKNSISKDIVIADLVDAFEISKADATALVDEHWK